MSALDIVAKLRAMAADPSHRSRLMCEESTLPSLLMFLGHKEKDVVFTALEIVYFLSQQVNNRLIMAQELSLLKRLKLFMMNGTLKEKKVAIAAYTNLQAYANSLPSYAPLPSNTQSETVSSDSSQNSTNVMEVTTNSYILYIKDLDNEKEKHELQQLALHIKGVISINCDLSESKAIIRATIPVQSIIEKLREAGRESSLNRRELDNNEEGDGYLPEHLEAAPSSTTQNKSWFGFGSLVAFGATEDRKARLERERKENSSSWLGKLGKALYIM